MGRVAVAFGAMLLALAVLGPGASSSRAAVHPWNIEELRVSPAEFAQHKQALALDGMALEAAEGLYQQYELDFNDLREARKVMLDWVQGHSLDGFGDRHARQDELVQAIMSGERAVIREWNQRARELGEGYFDDLTTILSVERESVEALRRAHLRHRLRDLRLATYELLAGVDCQLVGAMDRILPHWPKDEELKSIVQTYESALDPLLRRVDEACLTNHDRTRAAWDEVRDADERQREAALDRLAKVVADYYEPLVSIRRLNMRTVQQLVERVSPEEAQALRAATDPELRSYLFEHAEAAHVRLKQVVRRDDLTQPQQEALQAVAASLQAARVAAAARLDGRYDRAIAPDAQGRKTRAQAASRWTGVRPPRETPEEQEFHTTLQQWRETERAFNRQIAAAVGERWPFADAADPALIVESSEPSDEGSDRWIDEMFSPAIDRAVMDAFVATLAEEQPVLARMIRERHSKLLAEYEVEANAGLQRMRDGVARINAMDRIQRQDDQIGSAMEQVQLLHQADSHRWHRRRAELRRKMMSELTAMMDELSAPAWNRFVHALRRKQFLPPSDSDDSIVENPADLIRELDRLNLEPMEREQLSTMVDGYATEIGALLIVLEDQRNRMMEIALAMDEEKQEEEQEAAFVLFEDASQELTGLMQRIDVATGRHAEVMAGAMEPGAAAAFREALQRHRWPRAFVASPTAWAAERLLSGGLLDEAQRGAVVQLLTSEAAALAPLRTRIIAAAEQWTRPGEVQRRQAQHQALIEAGQHPWAAHEFHRALELLKRRMQQELDDRARLRGLLRADQLELCPPGVRLVLETKP